jgi:phage/plasmid-like protein (TIGR03299 family)
VTNVVCDNTLAAGLGEAAQQLKIRHSRNSGLRIGEAREALAIVYDIADAFSAEVARLTQIEVTPAQFSRVLDIVIPVTDAKGQPAKGRSLTAAEHQRSKVGHLYRYDDSAAPWTGTAWGVLQAFNTFSQHFGTVRNRSRVQRNREYAITGQFAAQDERVLAAIGRAKFTS